MNSVRGQQQSDTGTGANRHRTDRSPLSSRIDRTREALVETPLIAPLRRFWSGLGTCLMYHRIVADDAAPGRDFSPNRELMVRASEFDRQMEFIARHYNCLSLSEALGLLRQGKLPRRTVVVTFDDGYLDNLTLALPILRTHGVPATIYIATGIIDNSAHLWWYELEKIIRNEDSLKIDWKGKRWLERIEEHSGKHDCYARFNRQLKRMNPTEQESFLAMIRKRPVRQQSLESQVLNRDDIRQLADDPLITIGAHTHGHLVLSSLSEDQLRQELETSRRILESWISRPVRHLAYPFGGHHQAGLREFRMAEKAGFESATTTRLGHLQSFHARRRLALPRIAVGFDDSLTHFRWKLSGLECMMRRPLARALI